MTGAAQGTITTRVVSQVPWADVRTVFGTRGDPAHCWCQYFKLSNADWQSTTDSEKERMLCEQVTESPAPGVVAYLDDEPVGWCAIEPRTAYRRILTSKVVRGSSESPDDAAVWAVTCFVVRVGFRRRGVAAELLRAAVTHGRASGARVIEGYPVDLAERRASAAELYHGSLDLFLREGFELVSRPTPGRAVVRLT